MALQRDFDLLQGHMRVGRCRSEEVLFSLEGYLVLGVLGPEILLQGKLEVGDWLLGVGQSRHA